MWQSIFNPLQGKIARFAQVEQFQRCKYPFQATNTVIYSIIDYNNTCSVWYRLIQPEDDLQLEKRRF